MRRGRNTRDAFGDVVFGTRYRGRYLINGELFSSHGRTDRRESPSHLEFERSIGKGRVKPVMRSLD